MPLYEYKCEKCGKRFDALQKFSDEPLKVHEQCGGSLERLVSAPAFHFKGTGWYVTDYAKSNGQSAPASESPKDAKDTKTGSGDSGTKTETKSESAAPAPAPAASSETTKSSK